MASKLSFATFNHSSDHLRMNRIDGIETMALYIRCVMRMIGVCIHFGWSAKFSYSFGTSSFYSFCLPKRIWTKKAHTHFLCFQCFVNLNYKQVKRQFQLRIVYKYWKCCANKKKMDVNMKHLSDIRSTFGIELKASLSRVIMQSYKLSYSKHSSCSIRQEWISTELLGKSVYSIVFRRPKQPKQPKTERKLSYDVIHKVWLF